MKAALAIGMAIGVAACAPTERLVEAGPPGGALFVAGKFGNTLARIDLATGRETARDGGDGLAILGSHAR